MTRSRIALAVLVLAVATPAHAAVKVKPACNLVKDSGGDAYVVPGTANQQTYDPSLDIVSADVAANGKYLSAVIRLKDLTEADSLAPAGRVWRLTVTNGTASVGLSTFVSTWGTYFGQGTGTVDYTHNLIQMNIALADIPYAKIKVGDKLKNINVYANWMIGLNPAATFGYGIEPAGGSTDSAVNTTVSYAVGYPSCVAVPK